jgi:hypothetical protein
MIPDELRSKVNYPIILIRRVGERFALRSPNNKQTAVGDHGHSCDPVRRSTRRAYRLSALKWNEV